MGASQDRGSAFSVMGETISAVEVMLLTWRRCDDSSKKLS
jgi:hypothetical protein